MKYSFVPSAPEWPPSALMMAVSASGASSEPLASWVRYVPVAGEGKTDLVSRRQREKGGVMELMTQGRREREFYKHSTVKMFLVDFKIVASSVFCNRFLFVSFLFGCCSG